MKGTRLTGWRKIANALWDAPNDPQIYGSLDVDATAMLAFIALARSHGEHVTATHLVGRADRAGARRGARAQRAARRRSRDHAREHRRVLHHRGRRRSATSSGVKVDDADAKSAAEVARELGRRSRTMKAGKDPDFARTKRTMETLPRAILRPVLRLSAWIAGDRAKGIDALGARADALRQRDGDERRDVRPADGLRAARVDVSTCRCSCWSARSATGPSPSTGRVEVRPIVPITVTIDHRYVDGAQLGRALKAFREYLASPATFEPPFEGGSAHGRACPANVSGA